MEQTLTPSQAREVLVPCIKAGLPIMLKGAPGVAKTDTATRAAAEAEADILVSHPVTSDPTDAKGLPWKVDGQNFAEFLPFGDLAIAMAATRPLVWLLDDLGQAMPAVQASFMHLILARRVNGHKLPDHVTFIAATNRRQDRAGVSGILEPVKSRFASIIEIRPDVDEWVDWALDNGMPPQLVAFLRFRRELIHKFEASQDITNTPSPRTWANCGRLLNANLPKPVQLPAFAGAVGEAAAGEFVGFLRLWENMPDLDAILMDPNNAPIPDRTDISVLYAVTTGLADRTNVKTFPSIAIYAQRLFDEGHGEFATLLIKDSLKKDKKVLTTNEWQKLAATEVAKEIFGADTMFSTK